MTQNETDSRPASKLRSFSIRFLLFLVLLASIGAWYIGDQLNREIAPPMFWDFATSKNVKWSARLGTQSYSQPKVSDKYVFVGSNNGGGYDPLIPKLVDLAVLLCFDKQTGGFVWQHANQKLSVGRSSDWPLMGVTSTPFVDGNRLWYVNNRGEVICLDVDGFRDSVNDGPFKSEASQRNIDADVVWKFDMIKELGVVPHNISHCNVEVDHERVYVKTSNGVSPTHVELPAPEAPSFLVLDRRTGSVVWHDNAPGTSVMHGSWGSPRLTTIGGVEQILFPGGDGWLYSYVPLGDGSGGPELIWKFDCNPKASSWKLHGTGEGRNNLFTEPTVFEDRIYLTMGQDPEHGEGASRVWCIEPGNRTGDLSPTIVKRGRRTELPGFNNQFRHCIAENGDVEIPNPNSAQVWEYLGFDHDGDGEVTGITEGMQRSLSRVVIANNCAFVTTTSGTVHCIDIATGDQNWCYDFLSAFWSSPLIVGDFVFVFNEDGQVLIFTADPDVNVALPNQPLATIDTPGFRSVYSNATFKDGVLYFSDRTAIHAIEDTRAKNKIQKWLMK